MCGAVFYVYEHWRPDTGQCFYVGKGMGRRSRVLYGRNQRHRRIQAKLAAAGLAVDIRFHAEALTEQEAHRVEIERIAYWRAQGVELVNLTDGGEGIANPAEETRAKMRAAKAGRTLSPEHRAKIAAGTRVALSRPEVRAKLSAAVKRSHATPEVKKKLSDFQRTRPRSRQQYEKIAAALRGRKLSPEHVAAMRAGLTGRKQTPEEIERRRAANTGKKRSPEFCARMAEMWTPERRAAHAIQMCSAKRAKDGRIVKAHSVAGIK